MKRTALIIATLLIAVAAVLVSCTKEVQEPGMLSLRVLNPQTGPVQWENVYIATSYTNMLAHIYVQQTMTSDSGYAKFDSLAPGMYWFGAEHWADYGAVDVFFNIDTRAILWVNTPGGPKSK